jgi:hypothetical protein
MLGGILLTAAVTRSLSKGVLVEMHHDQYTLGGHHVNNFRQQLGSTPSLNTILRDLLEAWHEQLAQHNIEYWLHAGSLLGAYCSKGLLKNDDDLDVGIMASDFTRLAILMDRRPGPSPHYQLIVRAGLHSDIIGAKFVDKRNGRFIDVAVYHNENPMEPRRIVHYWSNGVCNECNTNPTRLVLPKSWTYPLRECWFGGVKTYCPRDTASVCRMMFKYPFFNCPRINSKV